MIQEHYLQEDYGQVTDHLEILHTAVMTVLEGATTGDFKKIEQAQHKIEKSKLGLKALNTKKIKREENLHLLFKEGVRRW